MGNNDRWWGTKRNWKKKNIRTLGNEDHICIKKKKKKELAQEKEKEKKKVTVTDSITNFML